MNIQHHTYTRTSLDYHFHYISIPLPSHYSSSLHYRTHFHFSLSLLHNQKQKKHLSKIHSEMSLLPQSNSTKTLPLLRLQKMYISYLFHPNPIVLLLSLSLLQKLEKVLAQLVLYSEHIHPLPSSPKKKSPHLHYNMPLFHQEKSQKYHSFPCISPKMQEHYTQANSSQQSSSLSLYLPHVPTTNPSLLPTIPSAGLLPSPLLLLLPKKTIHKSSPIKKSQSIKKNSSQVQ